MTDPAGEGTAAASPAAYGAGHLRRGRSTRAQMLSRRRALYEIVADAQPTGVRFTYYRAVALGVVPKTEAGYRQVQRALMDMREAGDIPYEWIVDATRWVHRATTYDGVEDALRELGASYRRALWSSSNVLVEVWCESKSAAGVLYPVTSEWDVPLYPISGQTSASFAYTAARQYEHDPREVAILYIGDLDPAGVEIEAHLQDKLTRYSGGRSFRWRRLACTPEQVEDMHLLGTAPKKNTWHDPITESRRRWDGPAVEVEAIEAPTLRTIVAEAITAYIDPHELRVLVAAEDSERRGLLALAGKWGTS